MKRLIVSALVLLSSCMTQDPAMPGRRVDVVSAKAAPVPHAVIDVADDIDFSIPIHSLVYKKIDVHLPRGRYELRYVDDDGYYFYSQDGRLTMTGDGNSWEGGVFVPRAKDVVWRVWQVRPNSTTTALMLLGPAAGAIDTSRAIIRHDRIPDEVRRRIESEFRSAIKANQAPEPTTALVTPRACARVAPSAVVAHL